MPEPPTIGGLPLAIMASVRSGSPHTNDYAKKRALFECASQIAASILGRHPCYPTGEVGALAARMARLLWTYTVEGVEPTPHP